MAFSQTSKREFWQCFWKGFGMYGICGLLHNLHDDHWGPTRNRFPITFLERYHIRVTKIWKISITTWTLSWRHPFKSVVKEPNKSCDNLSNEHPSFDCKVIPSLHFSLLENGDCQSTLRNIEANPSEPSSCNNWGGRCTTQFAWWDESHFMGVGRKVCKWLMRWFADMTFYGVTNLQEDHFRY